MSAAVNQGMRDHIVMRAVLEALDELHALPKEIRASLVRSDAYVARAVDLANAGGRVPFPDDVDAAWVDLLSSGWVFIGRGFVHMDDRLLAEFLRRVMR